jgi:hypothetical protein
LQKELALARANAAAAQEATKATQSHEREVAKKLEERLEELRQLKLEIGGLRKKNHTATEETKALREQLRAQADERDRLLAARPAFEAAPAKAKTGKPARPTGAAVAASGDAAAVAPSASSVASTAAVVPAATTTTGETNAGAPATKAESQALGQTKAPAQTQGQGEARGEASASAAADSELTARHAKLESERATLAAALETARETVERQKVELAHVKHYAEQLRRIDMISKGKVEILEDKVASLGRQYYEAVSELAVVKGDVVLPRPGRAHQAKRAGGGRPKPQRSSNGDQAAPTTHESKTAHSERDPRDPRDTHDAIDANDADGHATPEADALAMQMEAADAAIGAPHQAAADESP